MVEIPLERAQYLRDRIAELEAKVVRLLHVIADMECYCWPNATDDAPCQRCAALRSR